MEYDITYCGERCEIGKAAQDKFIDQNNSVYDAAVDFWAFTDKCIKTCPYKDIKNNKETS